METTARPPGLLTPYLQARRIAVARPHLRGRVLDVGCHTGPLAEHVPPERYLGVDVDDELLAEARRKHPEHRFIGVDDVDPDERFDTLISLAVIEHIHEPEQFLKRWTDHVVPGGSVVLTTPHARWEPLHGVAAKFRLTSTQAHDEHESVLDRASLERLVEAVGLKMVTYRRFLAGMNQLVVAER